MKDNGVYPFILGMIAGGNSGGSGGGGGDDSDVFWATYGTTTAGEVEAAWGAGKEVLVQDGTDVHRLMYGRNGVYVFTCVYHGSYGGVLSEIRLIEPSTWSKASYYLGETVLEETVSTAGSVSQALDSDKIYHFTGALTALTITLNSSSTPAHYHFDFNSGATAPTLTLPNTVTMPSGFAVEANKHYEIDILKNYGAVMSW